MRKVTGHCLLTLHDVCVVVFQLISLVGQCYLGLGDFSEAQTHFERALKLLTPKGETSKDANVIACVKETKVSEAAKHARLAQEVTAAERRMEPALTFVRAVAVCPTCTGVAGSRHVPRQLV
jgi:tetratricopeptide (TPR) repeat protein